MAVVKINALEVPEGAGPELERRFAARHESVTSAPGFLGFELLRPVAGDHRYFVYSRWETEEDFQAWRHGGAGMQAHSQTQEKPISTGVALLEFEVAQSAAPAPSTPATP